MHVMCLQGVSNREQPKLKCIGPGADDRIAMFGRMDGYSHTISTTSSKAQQLFNQASLQLCHSMPISSICALAFQQMRAKK